jgi:RNA polymerase sigma-70 factor (ECF subfamily)
MAASSLDEAPLDSGRLFHLHSAQVTRWASRLGGPAIDVDEVVQEVFLCVHRRLASFRGEAQITTWLYGITENVVRARRRKERLRRFWAPWLQAETLHAQVGRATPLEDLERRESTQLIYRALDRLADKYRTPFILFEIEGISGDQIAELLRIKVATVWVRLNRARKLLAKSLRHEETKEQHGQSR